MRQVSSASHLTVMTRTGLIGIQLPNSAQDFRGGRCADIRKLRGLNYSSFCRSRELYYRKYSWSVNIILSSQRFHQNSPLSRLLAVAPSEADIAAQHLVGCLNSVGTPKSSVLRISCGFPEDRTGIITQTSSDVLFLSVDVRSLFLIPMTGGRFY